MITPTPRPTQPSQGSQDSARPDGDSPATATAYAASLGLPLVHAGKIRELYATSAGGFEGDPGTGGSAEAGRDRGDRGGRLLMVATDKISAFDFVLAPEIPGKGVVLTQMSLWWFDQLAPLVENHVVSTVVPEAVAGRAVVCEQLAMIPVECVARGYLTGSGWAEYRASGTVCGIELPAGLVDGSRLPEPIFTPATKAALGEHDENVDYDTMVGAVGAEVGARIRQLTLDIYTRASQLAEERGIILADTKFEFGQRPDGTIVLADEVLTPDSSRFWDAATWQPGVRQDSFDKQFLRDWLQHDSGWDRASDVPPPPLPPQVVDATRARYIEAYQRLTGRSLALPG